MGFYIMLCTVHTTQGQRERERNQERDQGVKGSKPISPPGPVLGRWFFLLPVPFPALQCAQYSPFPFPVLVPCSVYDS